MAKRKRKTKTSERQRATGYFAALTGFAISMTTALTLANELSGELEVPDYVRLVESLLITSNESMTLITEIQRIWDTSLNVKRRPKK